MAVRKCDPAEILLEENDFEPCVLSLENQVLIIHRTDLCIAEIHIEEAEVEEFPGFGVTSFALSHANSWRVVLKTPTRRQKRDWINLINSLKSISFHSSRSSTEKPKQLLALSKVRLELLKKTHSHRYLKLETEKYIVTKTMEPSSAHYSKVKRTMSHGSLPNNISSEVTKQHSLPLYERRRLKTYSKFSENGPTLRELIKKSLLSDEWYHWSYLFQEENISGGYDLEKKQQIMMLQFIIYEVAVNIDLAELVNLAKQSINWKTSLASYNKRTIASCLDKMKQTSESLLAEFDELWKTKKNLIKVLYIYQRHMDRYDAYITYMSYFNDFQSVLQEATEHKKQVSAVLPSKRFGIMRTYLPLFQISALCLLLEELVNKPIFKKLEQFHCNLTLTQFKRIFDECLKSLKSSCGEIEGNNIVFEVKTRAVNLTSEVLKKTYEEKDIGKYLNNESLRRTFRKRLPVPDVKKIKKKSYDMYGNKEGKTLIRNETNEYSFAVEEVMKLSCLEQITNNETYSDSQIMDETINPLPQFDHDKQNLNDKIKNLRTLSSTSNKLKQQEKFSNDNELNTEQDPDITCYSSKTMQAHTSAEKSSDCNITNEKQFVSFLQINLHTGPKQTIHIQNTNGLPLEDDSVNKTIEEDSLKHFSDVNSNCDFLESSVVEDFDLTGHDGYIDFHNNTDMEYFWDYGIKNDLSPYFETYNYGDSNQSVLIESALNIVLINSRDSFGSPEHCASLHAINEAINKSMIFVPNEYSFYNDGDDADLRKYHDNKYSLSVFSGESDPTDFDDNSMLYYTGDSHESLPNDSDESYYDDDDDDGYESFSFSRQQVKRNESVTLKTLQKWRESFKDKHNRIATQTNDPLPDAPLYQNFNFSATPIILDDGHNFTLAEADLPPDRTEDFHIYENIIINDESIKPEKCQKETKDLNNCQKSSLRTLWCETLEVIQSGILDSMTHQQKKLQEAKFEIITSEVSYLKSLSILITKFVENIELNNLQILTYKNRHILFQYVNKVKECSEEFLKDLVCVWENDLFLINLGQVVLHHANQKFDIYIDYCGHQFLVNKLLSGLSSKNKRFSSILKKIENEASDEKFTMQSFLTLPMQRITRFPLLVEAILKYMQPTDEEYEVWKNVHASFIVLTNECNAHCSLTDNCTKKSEERNMFKTIWNRFQRKK